MKRSKKALYENIMKDVAKVVKRHLNEDIEEPDFDAYINNMKSDFQEYKKLKNAFSKYPGFTVLDFNPRSDCLAIVTVDEPTEEKYWKVDTGFYGSLYTVGRSTGHEYSDFGIDPEIAEEDDNFIIDSWDAFAEYINMIS